MNKFVKRLRSKAGESLIESMAAILIFTLASIMMYTMITAANDINKRVKDAEEKYSQQMIAAEMAEDTSIKSIVTFIINGSPADDVDVEIYGDTSGIYAYYPKEG